MAYVLQLYDTSTTIDFLGTSGASWCRLDEGGLLIKPPPKKEIWTGRTSVTHGRSLSMKSYDNRTVEIRFEIVGDDRADILDKQQDIIQLLDNAENAQMYGNAYEVKLKYRIDDGSAAVDFDVLSGELYIPDDIMSQEKQFWQKSGGQYTIKGWRLILTCKPFARGAEVQLVTNGDITNIDDATHNNYVAIAKANVLGDVPGPLRVRIKNTYASNRHYTIHMGLRDIGTPANFEHVIESQDNTNIYQSGSDASPTATWASTSSGALIDWDITPTSGLDYKGKVRVYAVTDGTGFSPNARYYLRQQILVPTVREGPWVRPDSVTQTTLDLGVFDLDPAGLPAEYYGSPWSFTLLTEVDSGSNPALSLRALMLFPAQDYKFRKLEFKGYGLDQDDFMEDIGRLDIVARHVTYRQRIIEPSGFPLHIEPGHDARLYFMIRNNIAGGGWDDDRSSQINVWHTPYYLYVRGSG